MIYPEVLIIKFLISNKLYSRKINFSPKISVFQNNILVPKLGPKTIIQAQAYLNTTLTAGLKKIELS